jgi:two-component system CheB/CheR fusion protein
MDKQSQQDNTVAPVEEETAHNVTGAAADDRIVESSKFRVVGLGASAGGLEAFTHLFQSLPRDPGLAFVLVQHLAPDHKSTLVQLLKRHTSMQVEEARDRAVVKSNCVYIIPPDRHLAIANGALRLSAYAKSDGANMAIDFFFRSLAEDQGSKAVGVVLSGAGTDGMLGLKAIKEAGGITFSQDEASAKFPSMPHNAILAGCADIVLPPAEIAKELVRVAATMMVLEKSTSKSPEKAHASHQESLKQIFMLLVAQCGVDFTYYKHSTIARRIERRMLLLRLHHMDAYVAYLKEHPSEIDALYNDILINVTRFFRDGEVFDSLKAIVFQSILKDRPSGLPIRIWVPGCSTGEEVYSIAICLLEYLEGQGIAYPVQIFGSDIDEPAIRQARAGIFPLSVGNDMSEERINKFFVRVESGYQIKKYIRDHCIFSKQNLVKDPPFSNLDLVSCRNVLIYLGAVFQKRAISVFHYALKPSGLLLLGTAEGIGSHADLFKLVDQKSRIHVKKLIATPLRLDFGSTSSSLYMQDRGLPQDTGVTAVSSTSVQREVDRLLLLKCAAPAVVVNDQLQILYFRGETAPYLQSPSGEASLNLLKMARGNLMLELKNAVTQAIKDGVAVRREKVQFQKEDRRSLVNLEVIPLFGTDSPSACFLILFEKVAAATRIARAPLAEHGGSSGDQRAIAELTHELAATKEYLQSAIAQHDAISSELNTASQELQSSNEELQSINEELESATEELQSSNEELATLNDELERRNLELTQLNSDLTNLVDSASMPTVMVDRDLRIRRFTPQASTLLNLIPGDVGRPLNNIKINMAVLEFGQILQEVVDTGCRKELEAQDDTGRWYSVQFYPYKAVDNSTDGAIVVFVDVDQMKRSFELAKDARDFAEAVVAAVPRPLLVLDKDLRVVSVSKSYLEVFSVAEKDTVGNLLYYLGNGQWGIPKLRTALENTLSGGAGFDDFIVEHRFENIGDLRVKISGRHIAAGVSRGPLIYMQIET